ncbi:MAG: CBS domain-containing protein [Betaproteobacteria bacterium]|jgi:CBS domain-containing protein|nr:CBS domain-containing protein [Betaproteobacteria bacterium]HAB47955.1 histidine kinase [Lautropia sp.]NBP35132.1 CBS domain-containing protein [Betaproteobacteria bacterium]NBP37486.1 CBS domain-containing protein [Betaproteobacteria bacterium]NBQ78498.1 CBS domain-containing protein [Betaproteobacteria bacterium]
MGAVEKITQEPIVETVRELIESKPVGLITVKPDVSAKDAMKLMDDKHIHSLLVYKDERLVGIISSSDYAKKVLAIGLDQEQTKVQDIMTPHVSTISPEATIMESMQFMASHGFHHLPVEEDGKIVGMVSWSDIMHLMLN